MATNVWMGGTAVRAQVDALTPGGTITAGTEFTVTLTDDNGRQAAISALAGGTTVAAACAAIADAINAAADPLFRKVAASDEETHVVLAAVTPGVPFTCAVSTSAPATFVRAAMVPNAGPNDYGVPQNWSLGHVPTTGEHVEKPPGTPAMKYGLDQSGVSIGAFIRHAGDIGEIGREEDGLLHYLRVKPTALTVRGLGGLVAVDCGAQAIVPLVDHGGSPAANRACAVYLLGTALGGLTVQGGYVGFAAWAGDIGAVSGRISVAGDAHVMIGAGASAIGVQLEQLGGEVHAHCSVPTISVRGRSTVFRQIKGAWTTADAENGAVLFTPAADASYQTTRLHSGARVDNRDNALPKTFVTTALGWGCAIIDPAKAIEFTNQPTWPEGRFAYETGAGT